MCRYSIAFLLGCVGFLSSCGQTGELYLPSKQASQSAQAVER